MIAPALPRILDHVGSSAAVAGRWAEATGQDCRDSDVITRLLLQDALQANAEGTVLFNTTKPERVGLAAGALSDPGPALEEFRRLVATDLAGGGLEAAMAILDGAKAIAAGTRPGRPMSRSSAPARPQSSPRSASPTRATEVLVLESGGERFDAEVQHLGDASGEDPRHVAMELATRRELGGASIIWGGRCVPFDPIDFETREVAGGAEWPVAYEEIEPYFQRACEWCVCGDAVFDAHEIPALAGRAIVPGFADGDLRASDLERWSLPTELRPPATGSGSSARPT